MIIPVKNSASDLFLMSPCEPSISGSNKTTNFYSTSPPLQMYRHPNLFNLSETPSKESKKILTPRSRFFTPIPRDITAKIPLLVIGFGCIIKRKFPLIVQQPLPQQLPDGRLQPRRQFPVLRILRRIIKFFLGCCCFLEFCPF